MSARGAARAIEAADGRVRRGERSRQRIVTALFDLIGAGVLKPTAQQVAARAGVGMRTVFRHFSEMETLYAAMNGRLDGEVRPALMAARRVGPLSERLAGLVRHRAQLFERVAPYKRAANLQRWRSRYLEGRHHVMQRDLRADLLRWLPELRAAPAAVVEAIDLVTSFEAWERLRNEQGLSAKAAMAVVEQTVERSLRARAPRSRHAG